MKYSKTLKKSDDEGELFLNEYLSKRNKIDFHQILFDNRTNSYIFLQFLDNQKFICLSGDTLFFLNVLNQNYNIYYRIYERENNRLKITKIKSKKGFNFTFYNTVQENKSFQETSLDLRRLNYYILNKIPSKNVIDTFKPQFDTNYIGIKSIKDGFELSTYLLQGDETASFNIDEIIINDNKNISLLELLKCDDKQKITAHQSHPNKYILKNINKFKSIYRFAKDLGADIIFLNYDNQGNIRAMIENREEEILNTINILNTLKYNCEKPYYNVFKFNYDSQSNLNINNIKNYLDQYI